MRLRKSSFVDFETGKIILRPMEFLRPLPPLELLPTELLLLAFQVRVEGWNLAPAAEMLRLMDVADDQSSAWAHSGFALLAVTSSYFEMIGKILNPGAKSRGTSSVDFNFGFCEVYPAFANGVTGRRDVDVPDSAAFRDRLRNGLYHLGMTKGGLWIHNQPNECPTDFAIDEINGNRRYLVNPHGMTRTIIQHFGNFIVRLGATEELHGQFRRFVVDFHRGLNHVE